MNLAALENCLNAHPDVTAAYLFGSAVHAGSVANDIDVLLLVRPDADKFKAYLELSTCLSEALCVSSNKIDLLFFDLEETEPIVLARAVTHGLLLKNEAPDFLSEKIEALSLHLLENESMMVRARQLRHELIEEFCAS
jgi:predicted nucleotidyltransferase